MTMSRVCVLAIAVLALALAPLACGDDASEKGRGAKARDAKGASATAKAGKPGKPGKPRKQRKNAPGDRGAQMQPGEPDVVHVANELPENFPEDVPLYPKSETTASLLSGGDDMVVSFSTDDSAKDVFSYYKTALGNRGWSVESANEMDLHSALIMTKDDRTATVLTLTGPTGTQITVSIAQE